VPNIPLAGVEDEGFEERYSSRSGEFTSCVSPILAEAWQVSGITLVNADRTLKVPGTLVSAYLQLHGKTDKEIGLVNLRSICEHDRVVYTSPWHNRLIAEWEICWHHTADMVPWWKPF
jgi:hypothetical protein